MPSTPTETPPTDNTKAADTSRLDRSLVTGIAWTGAVRWGTQVFTWISTFLVVRLLTPADYGLVGMAMVYLGFVTLVNEFGLGAAVVQRRNLTDDQIACIGGLAIVIGFIFFGLSVLLSGPIAAFYREDAVRNIVIVMSVTFIITGAQVLPRSLLTRDIEFRRLGLVDGTEGIVATVSTLILAFFGAGYWALVLGNVTGKVGAAVAAWSWRRHRLTIPHSLGTIAAEIRFGWELAASRIAWYCYNNADFLIVGRVLGKTVLGAYTIGWTMASIPVDRVSALVRRVTLGVFAEVQDDPAALRRYLCGLTEGISLVTFPASIGLALVAEEFVTVILGPRWIPAIVPLQILSLFAGFRSIMALFPPILVATNNTAKNMRFNIITAVLLIPSFYFGARWGAAGVALAWVAVYPMAALATHVRFAFTVTGMRPGEYGNALKPAVGSTVVMTLTVLGVRALLPSATPAAGALPTLVGAGALSYVTYLMLVHRQRLRRFRALFSSMRGGSPA